MCVIMRGFITKKVPLAKSCSCMWNETYTCKIKTQNVCGSGLEIKIKTPNVWGSSHGIKIKTPNVCGVQTLDSKV